MIANLYGLYVVLLHVALVYGCWTVARHDYVLMPGKIGLFALSLIILALGWGLLEKVSKC